MKHTVRPGDPRAGSAEGVQRPAHAARRGLRRDTRGIFARHGSNAAGKTKVVKILSTLLKCAACGDITIHHPYPLLAL